MFCDFVLLNIPIFLCSCRWQPLSRRRRRGSLYGKNKQQNKIKTLMLESCKMKTLSKKRHDADIAWRWAIPFSNSLNLTIFNGMENKLWKQTIFRVSDLSYCFHLLSSADPEDISFNLLGAPKSPKKLKKPYFKTKLMMCEALFCAQN